MTSPLIEIVYVSAAATDFDVAELPGILQTSRKNNEPVDITGVLLHSEGSFIQVLEGPKDAVDETFARIEHDPRHVHVVVLKRGPIEERSFTGWRMGYTDLSDDRPKELEGFTDYLRTGRVKSTGDKASSVLSLLSRFRRGRYRQAG